MTGPSAGEVLGSRDREVAVVVGAGELVDRGALAAVVGTHRDLVEPTADRPIALRPSAFGLESEHLAARERELDAAGHAGDVVAVALVGHLAAGTVDPVELVVEV